MTASPEDASGPPGRSLARRVQNRLQQVYGLGDLPPVDDFARACADGGREVVLLRQHGEDIELAVELPPEGLEPPSGALSLDVVCQVVEGVSHFLYLVERIRTGNPTTQLELELQAEVDKFVILAFESLARHEDRRARAIHARLYGHVSFLDAPGTEARERYRVANELAARFCARLAANTARAEHPERTQRQLRVFYRGGQADKIRLAQAA